MLSKPKKKAGWYKDPNNSNLKRYWDGDTWTSMTRGDSGNQDNNSHMVGVYTPDKSDSSAFNAFSYKNISNTSVSFAKVLFVITTWLNYLVVTIGVLFVVSIIPVSLLSLATVELFGYTLERIMYFLGHWAVIGAIASSALFLPIQALCTRSLAVFIISIMSTQSDLITEGLGLSNQEKQEYVSHIVRYMRKVANAKAIGLIILYLICALVIYIMHDPLMYAIGLPWADLICLITLLILIMLGSALLMNILKPLKRENPEAFEAAININYKVY